MARKTISEQLYEARDIIGELRDQIEILQAQNTQTVTDLRVAESQLDNAGNREAARAKENLELTAKLNDAAEKVAKLEKELESAKSMSKYHSDARTKAESELEQLHLILDGIDGAPLKEYDNGYGKQNRTVVTRLTGTIMAVMKGAKQ
jgi:chromosome segregation ATPase